MWVGIVKVLLFCLSFFDENKTESIELTRNHIKYNSLQLTDVFRIWAVHQTPNCTVPIKLSRRQHSPSK